MATKSDDTAVLENNAEGTQEPEKKIEEQAAGDDKKPAADDFDAIFSTAFKDFAAVEAAKNEPVEKEEVVIEKREPEKKEPEKAAGDDKTKEPEKKEPEKKEPEQAAGDDKTQEPGKTEPEKKPTSSEEQEDILSRLASMVKKSEEPEKKEEAAPPEKPIYTPAEQAKIEAYKKDWPDVFEAEALVRRAEYREMARYFFSEIGAVLGPMRAAMDDLQNRAQYGDIKEKVPDYDEKVATAVEAWVKTQPTYLQTAYNAVITSGTPEDVSDLISRFRRETGAAPAGKTPASNTPPAKKKDTELPPGTKQAAAALAPISSKRSAITTGISADDFDGAFDQFAKQM